MTSNVIHLQRWLHANAAMRRLRESLATGVTFFSICSGIEAASVAWNPLGWRAVGLAEIEKFPSAVLGHHYPHVRNHGDFTQIDTAALPRVDILCGGTPCQAFSVAGSRKSLDDARGNLTLAFVKLAHEINPRNVVWENVPGVLSTKDNAFGCFLAGLVGAVDALVPSAELPAVGKSNRYYRWDRKEQRHVVLWPNAGMVAGPKGRAAWRVLDAQFFGLAQRRKRVILVADFGNGADPAAVLFEPESVRRDSPPSRETGQGVAAAVAPSLTTSGRGVERTGDTREVSDTVTSKWAKGSGGPAGSETGNLVWWDGKQISATLTKSSHAQMMPDKGNFQAVVAVGVTGPISHALKAEGATALRASSGGGDKPHVLAFDQYNYKTADTAVSLTSGQGTAQHNTVLTSAVRRLTPRECERLQGFPDDYTRIPWRNRPASDCPDGPRYKALGNSWAVPLFTWLGERIQRFMPLR